MRSDFSPTPLRTRDERVRSKAAQPDRDSPQRSNNSRCRRTARSSGTARHRLRRRKNHRQARRSSGTGTGGAAETRWHRTRSASRHARRRLSSRLLTSKPVRIPASLLNGRVFMVTEALVVDRRFSGGSQGQGRTSGPPRFPLSPGRLPRGRYRRVDQSLLLVSDGHRNGRWNGRGNLTANCWPASGRGLRRGRAHVSG